MTTEPATPGYAAVESRSCLPARLRWLMATIALTVCTASALEFYGVSRRQAHHLKDFEIGELVGRQQMLLQRAAFIGTEIAEGEAPHSELRETISTIRHERERLEGLLSTALPNAVAVLPSIEPVLVAADRFIAADAADLPTRLLGLKAATEPLAAQWAGLLAHLKMASEDGVRATERAHAAYITLLAAIVSLLAVGSGEVFARLFARNRDRLRAQALDLERLALVAERTHNAVIITDIAGRMTWANEAFVRISGYTLVESVGKTPGSLMQFDGTDPVTVARLRSAIAAQRPVQVEVLNRSKGGRQYWLHLDIQPLRRPSGDVSGFVAIETDITEQVLERQRLSTLLGALPVGVLQHDASGKIIDANPEAERILRLSRSQLLGIEPGGTRWRKVHDSGEDLLHADYPSSLALATGQSQRGTVSCLISPEGERLWLRTNAEPRKGLGGEIVGVVTCFVDTTEASEQRRLLELTVDAAGLGTWEWQIECGGLKFNDRWHAMLGYELGALSPRTSTWGNLVHPADLTLAMQTLEAYFEDRSQPYRCEFRVQASDGRWVWVMAAGAVIEQDEDGRPRRMAGVHVDITKRKQLEQALCDAAMTDALTRLPNRHALLERLQRCRDRSFAHVGSCYAVLFMDFDRFKLVNDSLGHDAGDELLRQIAARMQDTLRPGDEVARLADGEPTAVRIGGDEFVVLVDRLRRPSDAEMVAQRLLDVLAQPYEIAGHEVHSTASIGIVTSDRPDRDPDALLRDADTAMYEAKRRGRGRYVVFSEDMHERVRHAVTLEKDLRRALVNGNELHVLYQPIVDLATQRPVGVEALVRWNHPTRGAVGPADFIPLAEECGLIVELGQFVLYTACRDAMAWRSALGERAPHTVSVNLSRAQIRRTGLTERVADVLLSTGLPAQALRLEITETAAMQDGDLVVALYELQALGVSLALDDFGTGYSSLSSLDQLPLDMVKIDRGFITKMAGSEYHAALIEATLRMAKALHLQVVAEGVETQAQADQLLRLGCPLGQGWLFGKPMSSSTLIERENVTDVRLA